MGKLALALLAGCAPALASAQDGTTANGASIGQLIAEGYEIKAAVPNGKRFVVFLQKDSTGYACEMAKLGQSQCGKIN